MAITVCESVSGFKRFLDDYVSSQVLRQ